MIKSSIVRVVDHSERVWGAQEIRNFSWETRETKSLVRQRDTELNNSLITNQLHESDPT
jgi:hypothetical protein